MLTKLEQCSWIKIEVARGRSTQECFEELSEACCDAVFSYRTVRRVLNLSEKAGMSFRTTSVQDDPTWTPIELNSLLPAASFVDMNKDC